MNRCRPRQGQDERQLAAGYQDSFVSSATCVGSPSHGGSVAIIKRSGRL